jgi:Acetyltransferase (GNAT) family
VLPESDAERDEKIKRHTAAFPKESEPILDSATALGGKPRTATLGRKFIPVGHISLNKEYETDGYAEPTEGLYWIATFYISAALQFMGLGRAAMDGAEKMAISDPLCAKTLALSTVANEYEGKDERWAALGREPPKVRGPSPTSAASTWMGVV